MQEIFIKRLEALMEENNMSQIELASRIGTTNVTISRYLSSERIPRLEIVTKIAEVFHTSVDYLVGLSDIKETWDEMQEIQNLLSSFGLKNLSKSQMNFIKELLENNKDSLKNEKTSIA